MVAEDFREKEGLDYLCTYVSKEKLIFLPLSSRLKISPVQKDGFWIQSYIFFYTFYSFNILLFQPSCFTSSSQISSVTF